ncbi:MAG: PAS domain-containing protein [Ruminococcus sp.]|nr:PAS domain-containing protein [Ruminococcus sp.]
MRINTALDSLSQGVLICDRNARILYFNEAYGEYIGQKLAECKGHAITEFRASAQVPDVIRSEEPIEGIIRQEGNQQYFASVYPIMEGETLFGTISVVTTVALHKLKTRHTNLTLAERVRRFEREEIKAEIALYGGGVEGKQAAAKALGISLATLYNKLKEG